jgi:16S rRNA (cytosine967-C5)-methyltransferase
MRVEHQIRAFDQIFNSYDGESPLHRFLFAYFKRNKQMGSSDRRWASRYIYSYFRLGKALVKEERTLRLAIADFLCNQSTSLVVEAYLPALKVDVVRSVKEKLKLIQSAYPAFELSDVFYLHEKLSDSIAKQEFLASFFTQPDLFIRATSGQQNKIAETLKQEGIAVENIGANTLAVPNGTKLDKVLTQGQFYEVQDLSSQQTGAYFKAQPWDKWWDCCAASGGKSLLLYDIEPKVELLVSDIRENSLNNLEERFRVAGIKRYQKKVLDLLQNNDQDLHHYEFDGIILDAPCSGSGTWGRTPEMLYYFDQHKIGYFSKLQQAISANVLKYLKEDKPLIYITCSVFKAENEDVIAYLLKNFPLKLEKMELIKGYHHKADTMFVARLIKTA